MNRSEKREKLIRLMKTIAREEAYAVVDEHLTDYEHKEKPAKELIPDNGR
jgi:predicted translin family RNA/ssDNA-binding protein